MSEEIRTIKTASTETLSGRSTITYEIGCKDDKSIQLRLSENTASGMFSKAWVSLAQIDVLLSAGDKSISSRTIRPLYSGSVNSAGFLLAALKEIGLVRHTDENSRTFVRCDPKKFTAEILALLENPPQKKTKKTLPSSVEDVQP